MLEQLRANFDFVIIDSSPLLPTVDTRLVCQHVDAVVLSVFRDVSQGPKVLAAQEMLDAFGVRSVEAVVTGGEEHGNAKTSGLPGGDVRRARRARETAQSRRTMKR